MELITGISIVSLTLFWPFRLVSLVLGLLVYFPISLGNPTLHRQRTQRVFLKYLTKKWNRRAEHGCATYTAKDNERVLHITSFDPEKIIFLNNCCRCCWSLEAGQAGLAMSPLPRLPRLPLAPLLESGGRSLAVLCPGLCVECVWWLSTTESFSLVRRSF